MVVVCCDVFGKAGPWSRHTVACAVVRVSHSPSKRVVRVLHFRALWLCSVLMFHCHVPLTFSVLHRMFSMLDLMHAVFDSECTWYCTCIHSSSSGRVCAALTCVHACYRVRVGELVAVLVSTCALECCAFCTQAASQGN